MKFIEFISGLLMLLIFGACSTNNNRENSAFRIRPVVDTVGFAHLDWQMDSVVSRIESTFSGELKQTTQNQNLSWRAAICPHDDYTYTSWLYPAILKNLKSKTVVIFGVAHKARNFGLENRIIFDSFDSWQGPYGIVRVSSLRNKILEKLDSELYLVHDSMQMAEHSVESMIPFLQHQNRDLEIISILVPAMPQNRMDTIANQLSAALQSVTEENHLFWGKDFSLLITTDAVHYGCEDWGGKNYAPFGCDSAGYEKAISHEREIIANCFAGNLTDEKVNQFISYTVQENDFREYKWTWCGRYAVPMGLKVAGNLQQKNKAKPLEGIPLAYETSISHNELNIYGLQMGKTAIANMRHWVGYAAIGFK